MAGKRTDWDSIEIDYLAGIKSIRAIASEFDCSEGAIRKKAKKEGWIRNPTKAKREQVKAKLAQGTQKCTQDDVRTKINNAINEDVIDMNLGLANARAVLMKCAARIPELDDVRDLKAVSEANKLNVELIRRIRGLDDEKTGSYEDDLEALASGL